MSAGNYLPDGNPEGSTAADDAKERALEERALTGAYAECDDVPLAPTSKATDDPAGVEQVHPEALCRFTVLVNVLRI